MVVPLNLHGKKKQGFIEEFFLWKISLYGFSLKMIEKAMEFF